MAQLWARQVLCLAACICLAPAMAIYEEQAGEHDWLLQHVGHVQHAALGSGNQLIVGTEANAVAALGLDTGAVQVRHCSHMLLLQMHLACRVLLPCLHALLPALPIALCCTALVKGFRGMLTVHVSASMCDLCEFAEAKVLSTAAASSCVRADCV